MTITEMTTTDAEREFDEHAKASWYEAVDLVKEQIAWLEYVPEHELQTPEAARVVRDCRRLFATLRRLNAKYID